MKQPQIVRYGELKPCRTAFIDAHTPGSDKKENFTIIGAGVSESPDQHVHINATPGFNIGAAGQPPRCVNSLHYHHTAEVFFVLHGRWRFFWGRNGKDGEVILEEGDLINIPTQIFRGFENVGEDYGLIMAVLGGDDAGGGVIWAPEVLQAAQAHGLVLGESGCLYDTKLGEQLPAGEQPMPELTEAQIATLPTPSVADMVPHYVARYLDMMALAQGSSCNVISEHGLIKDKPGFQVELINHTYTNNTYEQSSQAQVLMIMRGHWQVSWLDDHNEQQSSVLSPGDTCYLPSHTRYQLDVSMTGEASLFRVTNTEDPAGLIWQST